MQSSRVQIRFPDINTINKIEFLMLPIVFQMWFVFITFSSTSFRPVLQINKEKPSLVSLHFWMIIFTIFFILFKWLWSFVGPFVPAWIKVWSGSFLKLDLIWFNLSVDDVPGCFYVLIFISALSFTLFSWISFNIESFNISTRIFLLLIKWLSEICLTSLIALFWNFPLFWNFRLMICNFPLFSHSKNNWLSTLIMVIITS